jgi:hypothetical protein
MNGVRHPLQAVRFWAPVLVVAAIASGCGSAGSVATPSLIGRPAASPTPSPTAAPIDYRFQEVDAPTTIGGYMNAYNSGVYGGIGITAGQNSGTPITIGDDCENTGTISPLDCAYFFSTFDLPSNVSGDFSSYLSSNSFSDLPSDLQSLTRSDTVITSVDLEPAYNTFGISSIRTTQAGSFGLNQLTASPENLASEVTAEGASGRVVTALSFNSGSIDVFSYSWSLAPAGATYDTSVMSAKLATIPSAASSLASSGYFITAVGGDPADGFFLVGTKPHGSTASHAVQIIADPTGPPPSAQVETMFQQGYAVVAYLQQTSGNSVTYTWIGEK